MGEHRGDHVVDPVGLDQGQQRMLGAEGVPERELGVVVESFDLVDLGVGAADLAIDVAQEGGGQKHMVVGGVKRLQEVRVGGLDLDAAEGPFPLGAGGGGDGIEIPRADFRLKVLPGALDADGRKGDPGEDLLAGLGLEVKVRLEVLALGLLALDGLVVGSRARRHRRGGRIRGQSSRSCRRPSRHCGESR